MREVPALIGARQVWPTASARQVLDPASSRPIALVTSLSGDEAREAIGHAHEAARDWAACPPACRAKMLFRAAELLEARAEQAIEDLRTEGGKPIREAKGEFAKSVATFRYYGGLVGALDGRAFPGSQAGVRTETRLEPIGVTVAITPWNVPMASPARKMGPALLAGNPIVVKPASATPISAWHLVECLRQAGIPEGVVQLVTLPGRLAERALACDPRVAAVSFTGSGEVGMSLKAALGDQLTRLQLELGGKNAAVVLPDADLDAAAGHIVAAAYALAGQQCTATSRVIVHRDVAGPLTDRILALVAGLRLGDTSKETTDMGPLIDDRQVAITEGFIKRALGQGARLAAGGHRPPWPGSWYEPTVLTGVRPEMEVAREEVFGPVLSILEIASEKEAIEALNGTRYGLSSAVHTAHLGAAQRVAAASEHGIVAINRSTAGIDLNVPFGGFRDSGTDSRELGPESIRFYTRVKSVIWGGLA